MVSNIRVLLADDTLIAREGWKKILETEDDILVVGEAFTATDALNKVARMRPDILLMDLNWFQDEHAGAEAIARIKQQVPKTRIIAITVFPELIAEARRFGADTALPKGFSKDELIETIRSLHRSKPPAAAPAAASPDQAAHPTAIDRGNPAHLAAVVGILTLGFILTAAALMFGIRYLSLPQFMAVIVAAMLVYFFGVIFAGRYVDIINEHNTYRLLVRILNLVGVKTPRIGAQQKTEAQRDKQD